MADVPTHGLRVLTGVRDGTKNRAPAPTPISIDRPITGALGEILECLELDINCLRSFRGSRCWPGQPPAVCTFAGNKDPERNPF